MSINNLLFVRYKTSLIQMMKWIMLSAISTSCFSRPSSLPQRFQGWKLIFYLSAMLNRFLSLTLRNGSRATCSCPSHNTTRDDCHYRSLQHIRKQAAKHFSVVINKQYRISHHSSSTSLACRHTQLDTAPQDLWVAWLIAYCYLPLNIRSRKIWAKIIFKSSSIVCRSLSLFGDVCENKKKSARWCPIGRREIIHT